RRPLERILHRRPRSRSSAAHARARHTARAPDRHARGRPRRPPRSPRPAPPRRRRQVVFDPAPRLGVAARGPARRPPAPHPPPPPATTADAMSALKRRYEERVRNARGAESRRYIAQGDTALAAGDLVAAATAFRVAVKLAPGDAVLESKAREVGAQADTILS